MDKLKILETGIIFLIGFLSCVFVVSLFAYTGFETPLGIGFENESVDVPSDFINSDSIHVYSDKIVIDIEDASLGRYADTGSMRPVLDENSNGIRVKPDSEEDISVGDIISFERVEGLIVHRVIEKGVDEAGIYFITKGDNNNVSDGKVRFSEIKYKTVGVVW